MRLTQDRVTQGAASWLLCIIIIAPLFTILSRSFYGVDGGQAAGLTLSNFQAAWGNHSVLVAVKNTLIASIGSTFIAMFLGVALAWITVRSDVPGKRVLTIFNTIPFYLSPFVGAIAWSYLGAPRVGLLNLVGASLFDMSPTYFNVYGLGGIIWVQGLFFTPIVYLITSASLEQMDPSLEESSRSCGRGIWATMLRVTLPLATPAILSAAILTFVSSAGEFGVPLTLGVPRNTETLSTLIFEVVQRAEPEYNLAATMGTILTLVTIAFVFLHRHIVLRRSYTTVTGKGYRPATIPLGRWRWVAFALNLAFFAVAVVLPLSALLLQSVQSVWLGKFMFKLFTLLNFSEVLFFIPETFDGIKNSLILALSGATIGVFLSLLVSQAIYRTQLRGKQFFDLISSLPVGTPGIVLSMGVLLIALRTPFYGMLFILLIAYLARYIPLAMRTVSGVLLSISPEMEEASRSCGAGFGRTLWRITLPLVKPGLSAAWVLLFVLFLRELPISILLWQSGSEVMSIALWQLMEHATSGKVAAYALMQCFMILAVVLIFQFFTRAKPSRMPV